MKRRGRAGVVAVGLAFGLAVGLGMRGSAQTGAAGAQGVESAERPEVEVASIRRNIRGDAGRTVTSRDRITVTDQPLFQLIQNAYGVRDDQIVGGSAWIRTDGYDIEATGKDMIAPSGDGPGDRRAHLMLQALLEDRFRLKVHREVREGPVYELTVAKGGLKMPLQQPGTCVDMWKQPRVAAADGARPVFCDDWQVSVNGRLNRMPTGRLFGAGITMASATEPVAGLVPALTRVLGRTVIDKTGLTGAYQVHLEWTPDMVGAADAAGNATAVDAAGISIFTAVREELGLELKPAKGPVEVLVVDEVERPSEN